MCSENFLTLTYSTYDYISIFVVTATRLILRSPLSLESPQHIPSFKLLCRHHSNHYLSSTHDLCS